MGGGSTCPAYLAQQDSGLRNGVASHPHDRADDAVLRGYEMPRPYPFTGHPHALRACAPSRSR
jgi:hypothetical protein